MLDLLISASININMATSRLITEMATYTPYGAFALISPPGTPIGTGGILAKVGRQVASLRRD
jgi:hypothetical protein